MVLTDSVKTVFLVFCLHTDSWTWWLNLFWPLKDWLAFHHLTNSGSFKWLCAGQFGGHRMRREDASLPAKCGARLSCVLYTCTKETGVLFTDQNLRSTHQQRRDQKLYERHFTLSEEASPMAWMLSPWEWPAMAWAICPWFSDLASCLVAPKEKISTVLYHGGEEYDDSKSKSQATSQGDTNDICAAQGNCSPGDQCLTRGCQDNVEGPILNLAFFFFLSFCHLLGYIFWPLVLTLFPK